MLVVIARDRAFLRAAATGLPAAGVGPVVAAQSVSVALSLLEDNEVTAVAAHEELGVSVARVVNRRFPGVPCVTVTDRPNWELVAAEVERGVVSPSDDGCVVAYGLEELLGLLAMTRRPAEVDVAAARSHGHLVVRDGELVDARVGGQRGEAAALRILGWEGARVTSRRLEDEDVEVTTRLPIPRALHEAARRHDELGRLASRSDVAGQIGRLATSAGCAGVLLVDADNRTSLAERGLSRDMTRERLWAVVSQLDGAADGIAVWYPGVLVAAAPVSPAHRLVAATHGPACISTLRSAVADAGQALREIVETICREGDREALRTALEWG